MRRTIANRGALVALIVLVVFSIFRYKDVFYGPENLRNLFSQNAAVGILAVGMTLVIIGGGIDLSVGSMSAMIAAFAVLALNKVHTETGGTLTAIAVCVSLGLVFGLFNGLIITLGRIPPFIATLAGLVGFRSVALALNDGGEIRSSSETVYASLSQGGIPVPGVSVGNHKALYIQWPILSMLLIAAVASWILNRTKFGKRLIAVGANEKAAIYSGIATERIKWAAYSFMGLCVGIAALFESSRMNSVSPAQVGLYKELDAIAAVVIGGTAMNGGRGQVWTSIIGVMILGMISNMLILEGVSVYWQGCVKGGIILLAVLLQRGRKES